MRTIPFHKPDLGEAEIEAVKQALRNSWITMGPRTIEFEQSFGKYIGSPHSVAVNSATAALHLGLLAAGIKKGDEVIIPAFTFAATAEVVFHAGAVPVMVDVDRDTHCISTEALERAITPKTKAIIPVHYSGLPCDMDEIIEIARNRNIYIIEDAAHSLPSWYKGKKIGTIGDITCFSFYATKTLTTGEGGMLVTGNEEWAKRSRRLRLHGISRDAWKRYTAEGTWHYDLDEPGFKYNTTDINSSIGLVQLERLELMWQKRKSIAERYSDAFRKVDGLIVYPELKDRVSSHYLYPLKLDLGVLTISRNEFIDMLQKEGVQASVHFIPLYRFSYYKNDYKIQDFKTCEWIFERILSLPVYPGMSDDDVSHVISSVIKIIKGNTR